VSEGQERKSQAPCRSCSRCFRIRLWKGLSRQFCIGPQPFVHLIDHFCICTFLGTVNGAAALRSAQGIYYITGHTELTFPQLRMNLFISDRCQIFQSSGPQRHFLAFLVQKLIAQCLKHADASVICSASSDSYQKPSAAFFNSVLYHFSYSVGGCIKRISHLVRNQSDPCRRRHFDHRCIFSYDPVLSLYRISKGTGNRYFAGPSS